MKGGTIQVKNWKTFQHYKGRKPPWIKLHRQILENHDWFSLSGDACKLLAECWLLASEHETGAIPLTTAELCWRLRRTDVAATAALLQELAGAGFMELREHDASAPLAQRKQDAMPEAEGETETENTDANASGGGAPDDEQAAESLNAGRGDAMGLIRATWPNGKPPKEWGAPGKPWKLDREGSMWNVHAKYDAPGEINAAIRIAIAKHPGDPFTMAYFHSAKPGAQEYYHQCLAEGRKRAAGGPRPFTVTLGAA